jgi:spore maturation protein CgeB
MTALRGLVRTVVIGPDHPDSFARNISEGLADLGVDSVVVDPRPERLFSPSLGAPKRSFFAELTSRHVPVVRRGILDRPLRAALERFDPDLVISVWAAFLPEQIDYWRATTSRARWLFWYPDHIANLGSHDVLVSSYDALFFKEPYLVDLLKAMSSLPVHLLPEACNPLRHRSYPELPEADGLRYECDVAIVGNLYPYRLSLLGALPASIAIHIYGQMPNRLAPQFRRFARVHSGTHVTNVTKALAFQRAKVVLNTMHFGEIRGVNARLFEATGCGGFVLTTLTESVPEYFAVDKEVVGFSSRGELVDKLMYYLGADEERRSIARAGQIRAHNDHTYAARLSTMFELVAT